MGVAEVYPKKKRRKKATPLDGRRSDETIFVVKKNF